MNFDWTVLQAIREFMTCPFLDFLMPKITMLGNSGAIWLLTAGGLLCTKKYRKQGAFLLMGLLVGAIVGNVFLKNMVARPRPCWLDPSVQLLIAVPKDYSFPSGHTLASVISATILTAMKVKFRGGCRLAGGIDRIFAAVSVCAFSERCFNGGGFGPWHWAAGGSLGRQGGKAAARALAENKIVVRKPKRRIKLPPRHFLNSLGG